MTAICSVNNSPAMQRVPGATGSSERRWTPSNILSASRLVLTIPAALLTLADMRWPAFAVCVVAAITEVLDGQLARRHNEVSEFGKVIDPLADKVFVGTMVVVLLSLGMIPLWLVAIVLGRDLLILVGGLVIKRRTEVVLPSNYPGKAAVVSLSIALILVLLDIQGIVVDVFTWLSILLLTLSLVLYGIRARHVWRSGGPTRVV